MNHLLGPRPTVSSLIRTICAIIAVLSFFNAYSFSDSGDTNNPSNIAAIFILVVFLIGLADTTIAYWSDNGLWKGKTGKFILLLCSIAQLWAIVADFCIMSFDTAPQRWMMLSIIICTWIDCVAVFAETLLCVLCKLSIINLHRDGPVRDETIIRPTGFVEAKRKT